ncbi:hypothetical protein HRbin13_01232 [bacterium HR13]|nr:hypothetical protein HRbin13_01232 [bacterium HR13]
MYIYEELNPERLLIHLHGFASDLKSSKVRALRDYALERKSFSFFAMDMDYHTTTTSKTLAVLNALLRGFSHTYQQILLSGSSHGAYVILNYIKLYSPENIKGVFLFAPSYSTLQLTVAQEGTQKCERWLKGEEELKIVECETGISLTIHRDFAKDILERGYEIILNGEVRFPQKPPADILIVHGTEDKIVPVEHSRIFAQKVKVKKYLELKDDHRLSNTFEKIVWQEGILEIFD